MLDRPGLSDAATFREAMKRANLGALWIENKERPAPDVSQHWQWNAIEPLIEPAVKATEVGDDRRVLLLANPQRAGSFATRTLTAGIQILMPGEHALPHRHNISAIRFVLDGDGSAVTFVNSKPCPMSPGDLILTPSWAWHAHENKGDRRAVWFDGLDVPLHETFGTTVFDFGPMRDVPATVQDEFFAVAGFTPAVQAELPGYSPLYRYSFDAAQRALGATPQWDDGQRVLRYTDPHSGGPVMPLLDCYLVGLPRSDTRPRRSTSSSVCVVARGEGVSTIGSKTINWRRNDIFTIPSSHLTSHRSTTEDAVLFVLSDREILRRLGLLEESA
jgi:gentisate 1,2-dioxygenase